MYGQSVADKLKRATNDFLKDSQLKHAIVSLYVTDTDGNKIFSLNEQYGLASGSTQKVFTSTAAFSLLGEDFTYKTEIGYNGTIDDGILKGDVIIKTRIAIIKSKIALKKFLYIDNFFSIT